MHNRETMPLFLPRARRIATETTVEVHLVATADGQILAGPVVGVLCDISVNGACIEIESPLVSGRHLFYDTLHDDSCCLVVEGVVVSRQTSTFSVAACSIWMNGTDEERPPGFRIGLRFIEPQKQLFRRFK